MKISRLFDSDFLRAQDLRQPVTVEIAAVGMEEVGEDKQEKLTVAFKGCRKKLVCNQTNARMIASVHGDETDQWPGKRICLYADKTAFNGKIVDAVRVRAADPLAQRASVVKQAVPEPDPAVPSLESDPLADESVPF